MSAYPLSWPYAARARWHQCLSPGDDNRLLFQKFLEEREAIVNGVREVLQVKPNVKRCHWRKCDLEPNGLQPLQYMITLHFEMLLEGDPLVVNMLWVQKWDGRQL